MNLNYRIIPPVVWAILIYYMSSLPGNEANRILPEFWNSDKFGHLGLYGIFGILVFRAGCVRWILNANRIWIVVSILIASLYGASDEIHQLFSPGRSSSVGDWVADSVGGALGIVSFLLWSRYRLARISLKEDG